MLTLLLALVLADEPPKPWPQEPKDYRGIAWGASLGEARSHADFMACVCHTETGESKDCGTKPEKNPAKVPADRSCLSVITIGTAIVKDLLLFDHDRFAGVEMTFPSYDYSGLRAVFAEKYGPPSSAVETEYKTQGGAQGTNETLQWTGPAVTVTLSHFGGSITEGRAALYTPAYVESQARQAEAAKKKGAKAF